MKTDYHFFYDLCLSLDISPKFWVFGGRRMPYDNPGRQVIQNVVVLELSE